MKITRIQIDGILGISCVDVKLQTAVTLFAGANGSGKSSIRDAVAMAIAQQHARGITKVKEYAALVRDGSKAGGAMVTMNDDPDMTFAFNMPKGYFTGPEISDSMCIALDGQLFSAMSNDARRTFLFELTKIRPNAANVRERMVARGCDPKKIEAVLPLLRTGFPSVCEHAKSKATESKGLWRGVTGGTYGPKIAESWKAEKPEAMTVDIDVMIDEMMTLDRNIATQNQSLGTIQAEARAAADKAAKRESLAASVGKVSNLADQMEQAKANLAEYFPKVEALRARAGGKARVGLVHDMANYLVDAIPQMSTKDAAHVARDLLARYESEHGKLGAKVDTEAQTSLPEHESGLVVLQNRVKNLQRDLDSATQAKGQFDALAADDSVDVSADIEEVKAMLEKSKAERAKLHAEITQITAVQIQIAEADKKTADAAAHHKDVQAWTVVADSMAPDGIPSDLMKDALGPVNAVLKQAATDTDWPLVQIGADMAITIAGRARQMESESYKWRADAMIAQAVSEISGLKILLLDRVDVLDLQGRKELLDWLDVLDADGIIETALLFATLKAMPTGGLPESATAYWVEGGVIAGAEKQAA